MKRYKNTAYGSEAPAPVVEPELIKVEEEPECLGISYSESSKKPVKSRKRNLSRTQSPAPSTETSLSPVLTEADSVDSVDGQGTKYQF